MKLIISILLTIVLAFVAEWLLPWWSMALACFVMAVIMRPGNGIAFLAGFAGIFLFWLGTMVLKDIPNAHILSTKMAVLFHLPSYGLLMLVIALLGGLIGGLAALSGALIVDKWKE